MPRYIVVEKLVGETPLIALERARAERGISPDIPLAYAGRLDPMASGKLLILVGNECKVQEKYHGLDKEYKVEVLFGVRSDTGDVLGIVERHTEKQNNTEPEVKQILGDLIGSITLPYPHFSSKTIKGKPLHMWTLEGRLHEIEIPKKTSTIYKLSFQSLRTISREELLQTVLKKIETIPPVTDPRKALGEDFRREKVRAAWENVAQEGPSEYQVLSFTCTASSGTYMRSLAEVIGEKLDTRGLALSIHRTKIGRYQRIFGSLGFWLRTY